MKARDAERDDGGRAEPERFEARRREEQREQRAGDDDDRAAQRQLHAPAVADAADDVDELQTTIGAAESVSHVGHSPSSREYTRRGRRLPARHSDLSRPRGRAV